jgi:predicted HTH transcriptional regulator
MDICQIENLLIITNGHNGHNGHNGQEEKSSIKPIIQNKSSLSSLKDSNADNGQIPKSIGENPALFLEERKRKILNLVKENEWISIREIAASLKEFGEKSIQRDLLEMVEAGILKKTGDKRWRKYSLV